MNESESDVVFVCSSAPSVVSMETKDSERRACALGRGGGRAWVRIGGSDLVAVDGGSSSLDGFGFLSLGRGRGWAHL